MGIVTIDSNDEDLFKEYKPPILANGKHLFEVAKPLSIEPCGDKGNSRISIELRCQDEGEDKGKPVFENIIIIADSSTERGLKAKRINEARLAQFTVACGVLTQEQIRAGEDIPLEAFVGTRCYGITKVENSTDPNTGKTKQSSKISRYIFEEKEAS